MSGRVYDYNGPPRVCHKGHVYYETEVMREHYQLPGYGSADLSDRTPAAREPLEIVVSGGSMGGLFAAHGLSQCGHDVTVFERTDRGKMRERGAGIIAHPEMLHYLDEQGVADWESIATHTTRIHHIDRDGNVRDVEGVVTYTTSWDTVYRSLRDSLEDDRYRMGTEVVDVDQVGDQVTATLDDGSTISGDLFVAAEGYRSRTRRQFLPDRDPQYANYAAWRGVIPEADVPDKYAVRFGEVYTIFHAPASQILAYPVPGPDGEVDPGERRINWVWYCRYDDQAELDDLLLDATGRQRSHSLPPGVMREERRTEQVAIAEETLPEAFAWLVAATDEPFIQNIYDLAVPELVFGRVCLIGDASFFIRPHMAAGTAAAAADALELAEALYRNDDVDAALANWESSQLAMGYRLVEEARRRGDRYTGQF